MLSIEEHIAALVVRHDCVVVPGWGALISSRQSARYDEETGRWYPPVRHMAFNGSVDHNDGLLASVVRRSAGCTFEEATSRIVAETKLWKEILAEGRAVELPGIGRFTKTADQESPMFSPAERGVSDIKNFGLTTFALAPLSSETAPEEGTGRSQRRFRIRGAVAASVRVAASIAIIFAVVAGLLTATTNHIDPLYKASLFHMPESVGAVEVAEPDYVIAVPENAELLFSAIPDNPNVGEMPRPSMAPAARTAEVSPSPRYYLVVASLANKAEADRYLASVPAAERQKMNVLVSDSRHRVYIAAGTTFAEADRYRTIGDNGRRYPDAWVYKKR
ncbi:MAG: hypothetical protein NC336_06360 [Clostridium sp.]|nr:hypothetical protein [Clostridium sp.]